MNWRRPYLLIMSLVPLIAGYIIMAASPSDSVRQIWQSAPLFWGILFLGFWFWMARQFRKNYSEGIGLAIGTGPILLFLLIYVYQFQFTAPGSRNAFLGALGSAYPQLTISPASRMLGVFLNQLCSNMVISAAYLLIFLAFYFGFYSVRRD